MVEIYKVAVLQVYNTCTASVDKQREKVFVKGKDVDVLYTYSLCMYVCIFYVCLCVQVVLDIFFLQRLSRCIKVHKLCTLHLCKSSPLTQV